MKAIFGAIAVAIVAVLLAAGAHWFISARTETASNACVNNLRNIVAAKQQWGLEHNQSSNAVPTWADILPYLGSGPAGQMPHCPDGGVYSIGRLNENPTCSIGGRNHSLPDAK
jgi:hypothetical protein